MPYLRFDTIDLAATNVSGECTECAQTFTEEVKRGERIDEALIRIRCAYDEHSCEKRPG